MTKASTVKEGSSPVVVRDDETVVVTVSLEAVKSGNYWVNFARLVSEFNGVHEDTASPSLDEEKKKNYYIKVPKKTG